ncbi:MAG: hypothetical protein KME27_28055 [Lyngbya sp. HA4199-MV5]|nr:hypothetical protein [Lyngbya sp. HA4199-MV5]
MSRFIRPLVAVVASLTGVGLKLSNAGIILIDWLIVEEPFWLEVTAVEAIKG